MTHLLASLFVRAEERDWTRFLSTAADPRWLAAELATRRGREPSFDRIRTELRAEVEPIVRAILDAPDERGLTAFFGDRGLPAPVRTAAAFALSRILSTPTPPRLEALLDELHIARGCTPYEMLAALLPRFDGMAAITRYARAHLGIGDPSPEMFVLRRMLFERNVVLRAERALRYAAEPAAS